MTTLLTTDIIEMLTTWFIIVPALTALILEYFVKDDKTPIFRLLLFLFSAATSFIVGCYTFTPYISNYNIVLDMGVFGIMYFAWTGIMIIAFIITLKEIIAKAQRIVEG